MSANSQDRIVKDSSISLSWAPKQNSAELRFFNKIISLETKIESN